MITMLTARTENDRRVFLVVVTALIGLAWAALALWGHSPHSRFLDHHQLAAIGDGGQLLAVYVGGWSVMTIAMMLPTSLPLINLFYALMGRRTNRVLLVALLIGGYLAIWAAFGLAI